MKRGSRSVMFGRLMVVVWAALLQVGSIPANAVTPKDFGAKGDVVILQDGYISAGTANFSSNSATFTPADVGKAIVIRGAISGGSALVTKIQGFVSAKQLTLAASASTTVTSALTFYGTDDTAAIRRCVYEGTALGGECTIIDGVTFMVSNTTSTIAPFGAGHNPIRKGTINGRGRIIFAPQAPVKGGTNDRLFYISSQEARPMQISGAIAKGATSFRAQDPSEAATLSPGDWVIITERDSVVKDHAYVDWMEVSAVDAGVISTTKPFRTAFPNARPWAGPPSFWGLSFRKAGPLTSNIVIDGITIIIPKISGAEIIGIAARDSRSTVISNVNCQDASGNCFAGYMDAYLTFKDNVIWESVYSEFAAQTDDVITGNHFNDPGSVMSLPGPPTSGGLEVDFGTGFSRVEENVIGPSRQVCISLYPGIHDTIVSGNSCGQVTFGTGAACILARGDYRLTIAENTCEGGTGTSTGIDVSDGMFEAPMYSDGNRILNNRVQGFAKLYACGAGRLRTDSCDRR